MRHAVNSKPGGNAGKLPALGELEVRGNIKRHRIGAVLTELLLRSSTNLGSLNNAAKAAARSLCLAYDVVPPRSASS